MKPSKQYLKDRGIKDTLYDNGSWKSGALSQLLEEYASIPVTQSGKELREEIADINFIKWYSGMDEEKIRNAFKRYQKEVLNQK